MRKILMMLAIMAAPVQAQQVASAEGGVLRALDKVSGVSRDLEMRRGETARVGNLNVTMNECRYHYVLSAGRSGRCEICGFHQRHL